MEAVVVDEEEAGLLGLAAGAPGLRLERRLFDLENRVLAWGPRPGPTAPGYRLPASVPILRWTQDLVAVPTGLPSIEGNPLPMNSGEVFGDTII